MLMTVTFYPTPSRQNCSAEETREEKSNKNICYRFRCVEYRLVLTHVTSFTIW